MGATPQRQRRERRLGQLMVEFGLLTEEQLAVALAEQQRERRPLGEVLVALGYASSSAVHNALTEQHGWSRDSDFGFGSRLKPRLQAVPDDPAPESDAAEPADEHRIDVPATPVEALAAYREPEASERPEGVDQLAELRRLLEESEAECLRLRRELEQARAPVTAGRRPEIAAHKLFVPTAAGYRVLDRSGPPPDVGTILELVEPDGVARYVVSKVGRPLANAIEAYAYLQPA